MTPASGAPARRRPSLVSDLASSLAAQFFVVLGNVLTLRLAVQAMSPNDVGEFALVRRVVAFLAPLLLVGLGVGLPRLLGREQEDPGRRAALALAGWALPMAVTLVAVVCLVAWPAEMCRMLFGTAEAAHLARPLALLVAGNQVFLTTFAILRGDLRIRFANVIQSIQVGIVPVAMVALVGRHGARTALLAIGGTSLALALVTAAVVMWRHLRTQRTASIAASWSALTTYGLARVPGDFAVAGLYALGPILAAHALDLTAAGSLAIGLSLVTAFSAAFTPLGLVLLPRLSGQMAGPESARVRERLPLLVGAALHIACVLVVAGTGFGNDLLQFFLGESFSFPAIVLGLLVIAAAGNVVFVILRSVLDAHTAKPLNAIHAAIALAVLVGTWIVVQGTAVMTPLVGIVAAIAIGLVLLGVLTVSAVVRRFALACSAAAVLRGGATIAVVTGGTLALRAWDTTGAPWQVALQLATLFVCWIGTSMVLRVGWIGAVRDSLRRRATTLSESPAAPGQPAPAVHGTNAPESATPERQLVP